MGRKSKTARSPRLQMLEEQLKRVLEIEADLREAVGPEIAGDRTVGFLETVNIPAHLNPLMQAYKSQRDSVFEEFRYLIQLEILNDKHLHSDVPSIRNWAKQRRRAYRRLDKILWYKIGELRSNIWILTSHGAGRDGDS